MMQRTKVILVIAAAALIVLTLAGAQQPVQAAVAAPTVSCPGDALVTVSFDVGTSNEYRLNGSGPGLPSASYFSSFIAPEVFVWVLPGPGSWNLTLEWRPESGFGWSISMFSPDLVATCLPVPPVQTSEPQVAGPLYANLLDGRINDDQSRDGAAPLAVYCADDVVDIYTVDPATSEGRLVLRHVIVAGAPGSANELLAASAGVSLYRLSSGAYQLNTTYADGKPYIITWEGCGGANLTHLAS